MDRKNIQQLKYNTDFDFNYLEGKRILSATETLNNVPYDVLKSYCKMHNLSEEILITNLFPQREGINLNRTHIACLRTAIMLRRVSKGMMSETAIIDFLKIYYGNEDFFSKTRGWFRTKEHYQYVSELAQQKALPEIIIYGRLMRLTVSEVKTYINKAKEQNVTDFRRYARAVSGVSSIVSDNGTFETPFPEIAADIYATEGDKKLLRLVLTGKGFLPEQANILIAAMNQLAYTSTQLRAFDGQLLKLVFSTTSQHKDVVLKTMVEHLFYNPRQLMEFDEKLIGLMLAEKDVSERTMALITAMRQHAFIPNRFDELERMLDSKITLDIIRDLLAGGITYSEIMESNARRTDYEKGKRSHLIRVTAMKKEELKINRYAYNITTNADLGSDWMLHPGTDGELKKGAIAYPDGAQPDPDWIEYRGSLLARIYNANKNSSVLQVETTTSWWKENSIPENVVDGKYGSNGSEAWAIGLLRHDITDTVGMPKYFDNTEVILRFEFQHKILVQTIVFHFDKTFVYSEDMLLRSTETLQGYFDGLIIEAFDGKQWIKVSSSSTCNVDKTDTFQIDTKIPFAKYRLVAAPGPFIDRWYTEVEFVTRTI